MLDKVAPLRRYRFSSTSSDSTASSKTNAHADAAAAASTATEPGRAFGRDKESIENTFMFDKLLVASAESGTNAMVRPPSTFALPDRENEAGCE